MAIKNPKEVDKSLVYDDIIIIDNFLPDKYFKELQSIMFNVHNPEIVNKTTSFDGFPWRYIDCVSSQSASETGETYVPHNNDYHFAHQFFRSTEALPMSDFLIIVRPFIETVFNQKTNKWVTSLIRVRANVTPSTEKLIEYDFHLDQGNANDEVLKIIRSGSLYMNTNNGYTKFLNGTKVNSIANRYVEYPGNYWHCGSNCTDEKTRMLISINYI